MCTVPHPTVFFFALYLFSMLRPISARPVFDDLMLFAGDVDSLGSPLFLASGVFLFFLTPHGR